MKRLLNYKLWIVALISLSCLGAFYFTTVFSKDKEDPVIPENDLPVSVSATVSGTSSDKKEDLTKSLLPVPLESFADADVLRYMPDPQAMALLVSKGDLKPIGDAYYQPTAKVSLIEFLSLSLHWLMHRSGNEAPSTDRIALTASLLPKSGSATGEALTFDQLIELGFAQKSDTILQAAEYGIPVFSALPADYDIPIRRDQAAFILSKLAENALTEKMPPSVDLEDHIESAFLLRLHPYYTEIGNTYALGIFSNQEFPLFSPEMPLTRNQTASLLRRLFDKSVRAANPPRARETLSSMEFDYYSKAIYLFNNDSKSTVFSFHADQCLSPASLTKIMTVYTAMDLIPDLNAKVSVSPVFRQRMLRSGANIAGFYGNERVTYEDLLYATLLSSGAEAAGTLAIQLSGSETAFIDRMNQKAAELGMKNSHFKTVEGLDVQGQYTTAKDMTLLMEAALKNPTFYKIATTTTYTTTKTRLHPKGLTLHSTVLKNIRHDEENGFHILGGKSGTTFGAGLCWATFAEKNGSSYILVTLGAPLDNLSKPTMYQKMDALKIYQRITGISQ